MPLRVLIVPDKFKGTLTANAAARAIARGWRKARPHDILDLLPMSDGGDGFGEVMSQLLEAEPQKTRTVNAAHQPCRVNWWWAPQTQTAIVDSAKVIGLAMLPPGKFHPFDLDTVGLGRLLRVVASKRPTQCIIGIGGSATNDGGFGLARGLGWRFLDSEGQAIEEWTGLIKANHICAPGRRRAHAGQESVHVGGHRKAPPSRIESAPLLKNVLVAVDVTNPLLGTQGATRIYGPQKGMRPSEFDLAEACLRRLAKMTAKHTGRDLAREPGAGAAGGLGFGLLAFLGARLQPGFELFAKYAGLEKRLRCANLVITGEGSLDDSTLMGKGVGRIAQWCRQRNIPCLALAGIVSASPSQRTLFARTRGLTELTSSAQAKAEPAAWLAELGAQTAAEWQSEETLRAAKNS